MRTPFLARALALALAAGCAARPRLDSAPAASPPKPVSTCVIEGDGEPRDDVTYAPEADFVLFAARSDREPLARLDASRRHELHGRFSHLDVSDGRAHVVLRRRGRFVLDAFTSLRGPLFSLRARAAVVPGHVWLREGTVVAVVAANGSALHVSATTPFDDPRTLETVVACTDLAFDPSRADVSAIEAKDATAHVDRIDLYRAPGGDVVFRARPGLFFVVVGEARDGFVHVRGERFLVAIDGWMRRDAIDETPTGAGGPAGARVYDAMVRNAAVRRVKSATPILAFRAGTPARIGMLEAGSDVRVPVNARRQGGAVEIDLLDIVPFVDVVIAADEASLAAR